MRISTVLGYAGAGLTLLLAAAVPFYLMGTFTGVVANAGLHVDPSYSGGSIARTVDQSTYRILIYQPVRPHALQRIDPFVQIVFTPADQLPARIDQAIDLDGDGEPDVQISMIVPANRDEPVKGEVTALNGAFQSFTAGSGRSFDRLLVRTGNEVVIRVPLASSGALQ